MFSPLKKAINKNPFFTLSLVSQFFYLPLLFSNPYLENQSNWTCKLNQNCLRYLKIDLDKQDEESIYKSCEYEYKIVETCCKSLNNCPSLYRVDENLNTLKSNLLSSGDNQACLAGNMASLMSSVDTIQKKTCQLGARNCKVACEDRLHDFKRRIKSCFSINSGIDEALEQAKAGGSNSSCYRELKEIADKYKLQSRTKRSELREDLSVQDIVNCESLKRKRNTGLGTKKAMQVCNQANQELSARKQAEQQKREEEESQKREEERQAELERQEEEELARKQEEFEDRAKMLQADMEYTQEEDTKNESSENNLQAQGIEANRQLAESQNSQSSDNQIIKPTESEQAEEPDKKEEEGKNKQSEEDKNSETDKEDETQETNKEDKNKPADSSKPAEDLKTLKQTESSTIKPVAPIVSSEGANTQTSSALSSQNTKDKKTSNRNRNKKSDNIAGSDKTETSNTNPSQTTNSTQTESSDTASISSLAGNTNNTSCPVDMPKIISAVVFQSVSAPQIEPMNEQDHPPYNNYDLVMGKPAGVLVKLDRQTKITKNQDFNLVLHISGANKYHRYCFHEPFNGDMVKGQEGYCSFTLSDLKKEGRYKFFSLPMNKDNLNREKAFKVTVILYPRKYGDNEKCQLRKDFNMRTIKTYDLKLGFTRIDGGQNCYASSRNINSGYDSVSVKQVEDFVYSEEVKSYIPSMFPVKNVFSKVLEYRWRGKFYDYVKGNCNNNLFVKRPTNTVGLLRDIDDLEYIRASLSYHKLIAIVPESYFVFHRGLNHDSSGFIISPRWETKRGILWWKRYEGFLGGSWNIAFVHKDEENKGTVAHELAHTLGQGREFYEPLERCQQFKGSSVKLCKDYKVPRALNLLKDKKAWQFIRNKYSIMNNKSDIKNLWIDRDTFQKIFQVLSQRVVIPNTDNFIDDSLTYRRKSYYRKNKNSSLKAVISGFYYEKESTLIIPSVKLKKTKLATPSFYPQTENTKLPVITFELREGKTTLQKIKRPILKMQMKTLYKNKEPETKPFEFAPFIAIFDLPADYKNRDLKIIALSPTKKEIYPIPVPKTRKKEQPKLTKHTKKRMI